MEKSALFLQAIWNIRNRSWDPIHYSGNALEETRVDVDCEPVSWSIFKVPSGSKSLGS